MERVDGALRPPQLRELVWGRVEERLPPQVLIAAHDAIARIVNEILAALQERLANGDLSIDTSQQLVAAGEQVSRSMAWSLIDEVVVCLVEVVAAEAARLGVDDPGLLVRAGLEVSNRFFDGYWVFEGRVALEQAVRFGQLADRLPTPVFLADGDGVVTFANPALRDLLGVPVTSILGTPLGGLFDVPITLADGATFESAVAVGQARRHLHGTLLAIPGEEDIEFFGAVRDRSHEVALETTKRQVVATISHELRTPLTAVLGYLELLLEGEAAALDEAERRRALETMHGEAELLLRLVHDLVDYTHLETGRISIEPSMFLMEDAVLSAVRRSYTGYDREPVLRVAEGLKVNADRQRIEQLLTNLLTNAVRYGGPHVEVGAWPEGESVVIRVSDDGDGVAADRRDRIFETFYQGHDLLGVGAGIGLAVCRAVVTAHGGTIELEDRPGASFRVVLEGAVA